MYVKSFILVLIVLLLFLLTFLTCTRKLFYTYPLIAYVNVNVRFEKRRVVNVNTLSIRPVMEEIVRRGPSTYTGEGNLDLSKTLV